MPARVWLSPGIIFMKDQSEPFPHLLQADVERRKDRALRDLDYDSHLGIERDPISREIISTASHT